MSGVYGLIGACLASLGEAGCATHLLDLAQRTGARQVMVFDVSADRARCLLSCNYSAGHVGEAMAAQYLDGAFRRDPLLPELLSLAPGSLQLRGLGAESAGVDPDYWETLFARPGLAGKLSVLAAGATRRLFVNFYHGEGEAGRLDAELAELVGRLVLLDAEARAPSALPPALTALSEREREVCLGVLAGKKAETIAAELALSPATVATYRKRAYDKLGITSRGALFAICRQD